MNFFGDICLIGPGTTDIDEHLSVSGIDHYLGKGLHQGGFDLSRQCFIGHHATALGRTFETGLLYGMQNDFNRLIHAHVADMQDHVIELRIPRILAKKLETPFATLRIIVNQNHAGFIGWDVLAGHLFTDSILEVGADSDLENMGELL